MKKYHNDWKKAWKNAGMHYGIFGAIALLCGVILFSILLLYKIITAWGFPPSEIGQILKSILLIGFSIFFFVIFIILLRHRLSFLKHGVIVDAWIYDDHLVFTTPKKVKHTIKFENIVSILCVEKVKKYPWYVWDHGVVTYYEPSSGKCQSVLAERWLIEIILEKYKEWKEVANPMMPAVIVEGVIEDEGPLNMLDSIDKYDIRCRGRRRW